MVYQHTLQHAAGPQEYTFSSGASEADDLMYRFTDKPIRRAGAFETSYFAESETFASGGQWLGAPNAALTGTHDGQPYVVIVTLYSPVYDNTTHTLQYQVLICTY